MRKINWAAALPGLLMILSLAPSVCAQTTTLSGKWFALPQGKSSITLLTLSQTGNLITGQWTPPKGEACEIENGKLTGDTLTFSFIQDNKHFDATGHIDGPNMSFELIGPKKWGRPETIRGQAARGN